MKSNFKFFILGVCSATLVLFGLYKFQIIQQSEINFFTVLFIILASALGALIGVSIAKNRK